MTTQVSPPAVAPKLLVLASNNSKKALELAALLQPLGFDVRPQSAFGVSEAEEPHPSFIENALAKARHAARATGLAAIADDSGLCVPALAGAPGVRSARFAGEPCSDTRNNALLLERLIGETQRNAFFYCALAYVAHGEDPCPLLAEGRWDGRILEAPRGESGFGYDPLFFVPEEGCSAAELGPERKNQLSHRARAMACLRALLESAGAAPA